MRKKLSGREADRRYKRLRLAFRRKIKEHSCCRRNLMELFEKVSVGIFAVDLSGRIVFFNHEASRITGYPCGEILGHHFRKLLSLDDIAEGFRLFYQAVRSNYPKSVLLRTLKKDRTSIIVELSAAPFYLGGKLQGALAFMRDLSERKKLEEANRKRIETFIRFSGELETWHDQAELLKKEVNELLIQMGKPEK